MSDTAPGGEQTIERRGWRVDFIKRNPPGLYGGYAVTASASEAIHIVEDRFLRQEEPIRFEPALVLQVIATPMTFVGTAGDFDILDSGPEHN